MTHAACLTPPGRGAVATLAVRGEGAWDAVRALFRPHTSTAPLGPLTGADVGRVRLGRFGEEAADEVVLTVKAIQPLPWVEIHGHGGAEAVRLLADALAARGVALVSWQEFLRLGGADPLTVLAAEALAQAPTARTAAILLDQYHGAFRRAGASIFASLRGGDVAEARRLLEELAGRAALGRHLVEPWQVVLAGAPNVGKSSLLNALSGYARSVVAPTPGTTRDVVAASLALDGWPVEASDTAGLRDGADDLERQGIARARRAASSADLVVWVLDASAPPVGPEAPGGRVLLVVNKTDLPSAWDVNAAGGAVRVSARTGEGVADLGGAIARRLVPEPPPPGAAVPFVPRLADAVEECRALLAGGDVEGAARALGVC